MTTRHADLTSADTASWTLGSPATVLVVDAGHGLLTPVREAVAAIDGHWAVRGASTPQDAAAELATGHVDVAIVAIPPSAGALAFLEWMRLNYPTVTRLAAYPSRSTEEAIRTAGVAHQLLGHAPDRSSLMAAVGRSVTLRHRVRSRQLTDFVGSLERIPTVPSVYRQMRELLDSPDYSLANLADLVGRDAGMAIKVLQIVNSAYFGLPRRISNLRQAVGLLGADAIASLVLGMSLHQQALISGAAADAISDEWPRALTVARLSRAVASASGADRAAAEAAYLGGLLHNVGRLVLAANLPELYLSTPWPPDIVDLITLERSTLGAGYPELGAYLIGTWGLDDDLVEAVAFHAEPSESLNRGAGSLPAVHSAVALASSTCFEPDRGYLAAIGRLDDWQVWSDAFDGGPGGREDAAR